MGREEIESQYEDEKEELTEEPEQLLKGSQILTQIKSIQQSMQSTINLNQSIKDDKQSQAFPNSLHEGDEEDKLGGEYGDEDQDDEEDT